MAVAFLVQSLTYVVQSGTKSHVQPGHYQSINQSINQSVIFLTWPK